MWCETFKHSMLFLECLGLSGTLLTPNNAPNKNWRVTASQQNVVTPCYVWLVFQDASITQATSGATEKIGEFNPFSATEMVSASAFCNTTTDVMYGGSIIQVVRLCKKQYCFNRSAGKQLWHDHPHLCCLLSTRRPADLCGAERTSESDTDLQRRGMK